MKRHKGRKGRHGVTVGGLPVEGIMEVDAGEEIAGLWVSDSVPGGSFYKLLAKRKADGSFEWAHFVQRADGSKASVFKGTVESEERLVDVVAAIDASIAKTFGAGIRMRPAEVDISLVDGIPSGPGPRGPQ